MITGCPADGDGDGDADGDGDVDGDADSDGDGDADCDPEAECCDDSDCSNGLYCDGIEVCDRGICEHDPQAVMDPVSGQFRIFCNDNIACTLDQCDENANMCVHIPQHDACNDGDLCDGAERCDPADDEADVLTGCVEGLPMICDDGDDCTADFCQDNRCQVAIRDGDGDGHPDRNCQVCDEPGECTRGDDCDDNDATIYPGTVEICGDGKDNNCDRDTDYADPDCGVPNEACGGALELVEGETVFSSTRGTRADVEEGCGPSSERDVVFYFTLWEESDIDVGIEARTGQNLHVALTADCDNAQATLACEAGRSFEFVKRALEPGTYYVVVAASAELDFSIEMSSTPTVAGPSGDLCRASMPIEADGSVASATTVGMIGDYTFGCLDLDDDEETQDVVFDFALDTEQTVDITASLSSGSGTVAMAVQGTCGLTTAEYGCWTGDTSVTGRLWRLLPGRYFLLVATTAAAELEVSVTASPLDPDLYIAEDFSGEPVGWVLSGAWEQGVPSGGGDPEPDAGGCIATVIGGTYPLGMSFASDYAMTPAIDLRGAVAPTLRFRSWMQFPTYNAGGHLEVGTDPYGTFTELPSREVTPAYDGSDAGGWVWWGERTTWSNVTADLSDYIDQVIYIRFAAYSDAYSWSTVGQGWYVDNVMVIEP